MFSLAVACVFWCMRAALILQSRLVCVLSWLHTMQNTALSWCYFFAEGVKTHFTYKIKCTVNQWTKLKICVGGGGEGVALHGCDMYILHSHSHRHVDE